MTKLSPWRGQASGPQAPAATLRIGRASLRSGRAAPRSATKISLRFSRPNARQVDRQVVLVRHDEADRGDLVDAVEHGLPHRVERVLHRLALDARRTTSSSVRRTAATSGRSRRRRRGTASWRSATWPAADRASRAASCTRRAGSPRTPNAPTSGSPDPRRRRRRSSSRSARLDGGRARLGPRRHEGVRRARGRRVAIRPHGCSVRSMRTRVSRGLRSRKCRASAEPNASGSPTGSLRRQRIDGVLHRVGRQHVAVVAVGVGLRRSRPRSGWRPSGPAGRADRRAAQHLDEPDARLAVGRLSEHAGLRAKRTADTRGRRS